LNLRKMANKMNNAPLVLFALMALLTPHHQQVSAMAIRSRGRFPFADPEALASTNEGELSGSMQAANITSNETANETSTSVANESSSANDSSQSNSTAQVGSTEQANTTVSANTSAQGD